MNKRSSKVPRVFIIIGSIALLAVAFYILIARQRTQVPVVTNVEDVQVDGVGTDASKEPISGVGTFRQLAEGGKDLECQIVYEKEGQTATEGTFFVSRGNMRGDFLVPAPEFGGTVLSSMIIGGSSMYVWTKIGDDMFGFKSDVAKPTEKKIDTKEPIALDDQVKYTCKEWTVVDGSVFVPPAGIEFKDLNAVINAGMEYGTVPD
ncbi:MAG: hypothetical protein RLZZ480_747 [Candidatus Parcubacteria bacterium]|jgi:hypothetical protein